MTMTRTGTPKQMIEFLVEEYVDAMQRQNRHAAARGQKPPFDITAMVDSLSSFRQFAKDYLDRYRPQQLLTNLDGNYGVQLTNLKTYTIGVPMQEQKGAMQPSGHTAVTGAETAEDMQAAGAVPLSNARHLVPPGAVDFTRPGGQRNLASPQPTVRFDQQDPQQAR